jgi:hypothetical protein
MIDINGDQGTYPTISHRVAAGYLRFLVAYPSGAAQPQDDEANARQDLYGFFRAFYENLYRQPDLFGLPLKADDCIEEDESHEKEKKAEVTARMKNSKEMIGRALDFLIGAGVDGQRMGERLVLAQGSQLIQQTKVVGKFLKGLESAGLVLAPENDQVTLQNHQFPAMLPALQALARACAQYPRQQEVRFYFARCDFRALKPGYGPEAMDLYRETAGADLARLAALHEYYTGLGYHATCGVSEPFFWIVQYQGDRKIKATPLMQIAYEERYRNPVRAYIKCASTARIAALLPGQSEALQEDFMRRVNVCRGDECGWCRNNKTLGPTVMEYKGEEKTLCWYSFPDIRNFDDHSVELMEEYARMHAAIRKDSLV